MLFAPLSNGILIALSIIINKGVGVGGCGSCPWPRRLRGCRYEWNVNRFTHVSPKAIATVILATVGPNYVIPDNTLSTPSKDDRYVTVSL